MQRFKNLFLTILVLLNCALLKAQLIETDTTNNQFSYFLSDLDLLSDTLYLQDSMIDRFHVSHTLLTKYAAIQDQGMLWTAYRSLELDYQSQLYFNDGLQSFGDLRFKPTNSLKINGKPLSDLHYAQGSPEMIYITAKHNQQLGEYASFGVDYRRVKMQNIYFNNLENQDRTRIPNLHNTLLNFRLDPPSGKYLLVLQYVNNKIINQETGGIPDQGFFDSLGARSKLFNSSAMLPSAQNVFKDNIFQLNQYWTPSGKKDSFTEPNVRVFHEFSVNSLKNEFNAVNDDSLFFKNYFYGNITADKQQFNYINNRIGASFKLADWKANISLFQQSLFFKGINHYKKNYTTLFTQAKMRYATAQSTLNASLDYGIGGYNNGDLYAQGYYLRILNQLVKTDFNFSYIIQEPQFQANYMNSNHYQWNNKFSKIQNISANLNLVIGKKEQLKLTTQLGNLKNFIYFSADGSPVQIKTKASWYKLKLTNNIKLGVFGNRNELVFQNISATINPMPKFIVQSSLYGTGWLFKKNLWLQSGIELFYYSQYKAPSYNPATRQFQIDNQGNFGNYPITDVYLDAKVRTLMFMFRYHHVNQMISPGSYILSPGYPNLPRSFSLGIRWLLTN